MSSKSILVLYWSRAKREKGIRLSKWIKNTLENEGVLHRIFDNNTSLIRPENTGEIPCEGSMGATSI
jgi:hypothetical protein